MKRLVGATLLLLVSLSSAERIIAQVLPGQNDRFGICNPMEMPWYIRASSANNFQPYWTNAENTATNQVYGNQFLFSLSKVQENKKPVKYKSFETGGKYLLKLSGAKNEKIYGGIENGNAGDFIPMIKTTTNPVQFQIAEGEPVKWNGVPTFLSGLDRKKSVPPRGQKLQLVQAQNLEWREDNKDPLDNFYACLPADAGDVCQWVIYLSAKTELPADDRLSPRCIKVHLLKVWDEIEFEKMQIDDNKRQSVYSNRKNNAAPPTGETEEIAESTKIISGLAEKFKVFMRNRLVANRPAPPPAQRTDNTVAATKKTGPFKIIRDPVRPFNMNEKLDELMDIEVQTNKDHSKSPKQSQRLNPMYIDDQRKNANRLARMGEREWNALPESASALRSTTKVMDIEDGDKTAPVVKMEDDNTKVEEIIKIEDNSIDWSKNPSAVSLAQSDTSDEARMAEAANLASQEGQNQKGSLRGGAAGGRRRKGRKTKDYDEVSELSSNTKQVIDALSDFNPEDIDYNLERFDTYTHSPSVNLDFDRYNENPIVFGQGQDGSLALGGSQQRAPNWPAAINSRPLQGSAENLFSIEGDYNDERYDGGQDFERQMHDAEQAGINAAIKLSQNYKSAQAQEDEDLQKAIELSKIDVRSRKVKSKEHKKKKNKKSEKIEKNKKFDMRYFDTPEWREEKRQSNERTRELEDFFGMHNPSPPREQESRRERLIRRRDSERNEEGWDTDPSSALEDEHRGRESLAWKDPSTYDRVSPEVSEIGSRKGKKKSKRGQNRAVKKPETRENRGRETSEDQFYGGDPSKNVKPNEKDENEQK